MSTGTRSTGGTVSFDALRRFTTTLFESAGLSEADARTGADVLVMTDAWGVFNHGTKFVRGFLRRLWEPIPNDWLIGADGLPTTDPGSYPKVGALKPAARHKGYSLALLIESLAGFLQKAAQLAGVEFEAYLPTPHPT